MLQLGPATAAVPYLPSTSRMSVACLFAALLLCGLRADGAQFQERQNSESATRRVQGTVRTTAGQRLGIFAKVQLEGEEGGLVSEALTDSDGMYHFDGLTGRAYRLIVIADGFEKHEEFIQSSMGIQLTICNITLKPLPKDSANAATSQPRPARLAPKQARKDYEKATQELAAQHLDKAEAYLQSAIKLYPCYAAAQAHLATILQVHHDPAGAEAGLRKAIQCDPDYVSSYTLLGQLLNEQKRFAESVPMLEAGERRSPASWALCYELGIAYFGIGEYAKAEGEYRKVPQFTSSPPPDLPLRLADVYVKELAYDKAYAQMKQYLQAQPNGPYAAKVRGIVQQVDALGVPAQQAQKQ